MHLRLDTLCVSAPSTPDTRIDAIRAAAVGDQSALVAVIEDWRQGGRRLRDCAVLARLWAQALGLELALMERAIPYHKPKRDLFSVKEVVGLLGWLRLAAGNLFADVRTPASRFAFEAELRTGVALGGMITECSDPHLWGLAQGRRWC